MEGEHVSVAHLLSGTYTDGFLVLHHGRVVTENYWNGLTPGTVHLLMSVSKSLVGTLAGIVVEQGRLSVEDCVTDVIPDLRTTSFEGCTVRQVLDMTTGTRFSEDYTDRSSDSSFLDYVAGWSPIPPGLDPPDAFTYIASLGKERDHGDRFQYRSILTDLLGWILMRATGLQLPELLSAALWSRLGAEHDAHVTVDAHGFPWADGGICVTLRDLARFGQMHLQNGFFNDHQIVPVEWVMDTRDGEEGSRQAFAKSEYADRYPEGFYRNMWWVIRPDDQVYIGSGIHGQLLYINVPAAMVAVKLSSLPMALDLTIGANVIRAMDAIALRL